MLSNSNVFILLILVKHSTLFWLILLVGAVAATHTISGIDVVDATTDTSNVATGGASSNLANSFDHYKNIVSSAANAQKRKNANTLASDDGVGKIASLLSSSPTAKRFRLNGTAVSDANHDQLDNNGGHFKDNVTKDYYKPSTLSTPSISTSLFQAAKMDARTMTPAPSAHTKTLSKLKLADLSSTNKSFIDNNNNHNNNINHNRNDSAVHVSKGIGGNGTDSNQSHYHNVNKHKNHHHDDDDDGANDDGFGNQELPQADSSTIDLSTSRLPEFPQRNDAVYFIVAVTGGAKIWSRTLARTLIEMGTPFGSPQGPPLRPIYIDLPANGR